MGDPISQMAWVHGHGKFEKQTKKRLFSFKIFTNTHFTHGRSARISNLSPVFAFGANFCFYIDLGTLHPKKSCRKTDDKVCLHLENLTGGFYFACFLTDFGFVKT